ncbi:hypothetical protein V1281_002236 [Nitrobacteraceae bacterium AZCC 2161]
MRQTGAHTLSEAGESRARRRGRGPHPGYFGFGIVAQPYNTISHVWR